MPQFTLYSYFRSSASYRVRIALNLKKIPYDYRAVHLLNNGGEQHADSYISLNPSRQVPTLVHHDRAIGQSMAILDYLDHVQPEPALFPTNPFERALNIQACEIINSGIQPLHNLRVLQELGKRFDADQIKKDEWAAFWIESGLQILETFLKPHAGEYAFGARASAADCFIAPHFANADRYKISVEPYPTLMRLKSTYNKHEAFISASPDKQPDAPR